MRLAGFERPRERRSQVVALGDDEVVLHLPAASADRFDERASAR